MTIREGSCNAAKNETTAQASSKDPRSSLPQTGDTEAACRPASMPNSLAMPRTRNLRRVPHHAPRKNAELRRITLIGDVSSGPTILGSDTGPELRFRRF